MKYLLTFLLVVCFTIVGTKMVLNMNRVNVSLFTATSGK